jgi:hypothetical protein
MENQLLAEIKYSVILDIITMNSLLNLVYNNAKLNKINQSIRYLN